MLRTIPLKTNNRCLPSSSSQWKVTVKWILTGFFPLCFTTPRSVEVDLHPFGFLTEAHTHPLPASLELVQDLERRVCLGAFPWSYLRLSICEGSIYFDPSTLNLELKQEFKVRQEKRVRWTLNMRDPGRKVRTCILKLSHRGWPSLLVHIIVS